jgi:hypothetical protein
VRLFALFLVLFISQAQAQLATQLEITQDLTAASGEEAKKEFLFYATIEAVRKFAPELGFDYELFDRKLQERFEDYFLKFKESIYQQKFGKTYSETMAEEQKKTFFTGLDAKRNEEYIKFSRILELLQSYTFISITPLENHPQRWKALVQLTLDRVRLDRLFRRILSGENKSFNRLYLVTNLNLVKMNWQDLGLTKGSSFTGPISHALKKWISENLPANTEEIELCDEECLSVYETWLTKTQEEIIQGPLSEKSGGIWLQVDLNLTKTLEGHQWFGRMVGLDINTKRVLASIALPARTWRPSTQGPHELNSALASEIYNSLRSPLGELSKYIGRTLKLNRWFSLVLQGQAHIGDILALIDLLKTRGAYLGLEAKLVSFSQKEAKLLCFYQGEEKTFIDLLSQLKELKLSKSYTGILETIGNDHLLKLVTE